MTLSSSGSGPGSIVGLAVVTGLGVILGVSVVTAGWLSAKWVALVLAVVLVAIVMAVIGDARKTLLALILLETPWQLDIHIFYKEEPASLGAIGGLGVSLTTLAIGALYLLWMLDTPAKRDSWTARPTLIAARPILLYMSFVVLSVIVAQERQLAMFEIFTLVQTLLLFIYVAHWIRTRDHVLFVVTFLILGLFAESLVMISTPFIGHKVTTLGIKLVMWDDGRVGGTLGTPNHAASYLAMLLPLAFSVLLARVSGARRLLAAMAFTTGGIAIVLTQSRGGWIALIAAILLLSIGALRREWLSPHLALGIVAIGICAIVLAQGPIVTRLTTPDEGAAYARFPLMILALRMIAGNFVLGVGANNFAIRIEDYATGWLSEEWLYTVHNKYLLVAAENGLLALVFFVLFLLAAVRRGLWIWRRQDGLLSPLALGITAAIAGHMVHMMVDVFNDRSHIQMLWLYAAMLIPLERIMAADPPGETPETIGDLATHPGVFHGN